MLKYLLLRWEILVPGGEGKNQPNSIKIEVLDLETNISTTYDSMNAAARALNIPQSGITYNLKSKKQKPYKGRSVFKLLEYFV